jgi:two-component system KDP operon response regulator KdpE
VNEICVDFNKHRVFNGSDEVHLTPIEYDILSLLVKNHGKVLTHHYILKNIWGSQSIESDIQTLRVTMANLRRKIEKDPAQPKYIITEIGVGYRFLD